MNKNDPNQATKYFYDGDIYKGSIVKGVMEGKGQYFFNNGDTYIGQFSNGEYNGKGSYIYNDNAIQEGYYEDGERQVISYEFEPDEHYICEMDAKEDDLDTNGRIIDFCGTMHQGEFIDDEIYGQATFTDLEGNEREAEYDDDRIVKWIN